MGWPRRREAPCRRQTGVRKRSCLRACACAPPCLSQIMPSGRRNTAPRSGRAQASAGGLEAAVSADEVWCGGKTRRGAGGRARCLARKAGWRHERVVQLQAMPGGAGGGEMRADGVMGSGDAIAGRTAGRSILGPGLVCKGGRAAGCALALSRRRAFRHAGGTEAARTGCRVPALPSGRQRQLAGPAGQRPTTACPCAFPQDSPTARAAWAERGPAPQPRARRCPSPSSLHARRVSPCARLPPPAVWLSVCLSVRLSVRLLASSSASSCAPHSLPRRSSALDRARCPRSQCAACNPIRPSRSLP